MRSKATAKCMYLSERGVLSVSVTTRSFYEAIVGQLVLMKELRSRRVPRPLAIRSQVQHVFFLTIRMCREQCISSSDALSFFLLPPTSWIAVPASVLAPQLLLPSCLWI